MIQLLNKVNAKPYGFDETCVDKELIAKISFIK